MSGAQTGEPRTVRCPSCGKDFFMAAFYSGTKAVACPWCLAPVKVG